MDSEGFTYVNKKKPSKNPVKPKFASGYSSYNPFSSLQHVGNQAPFSPQVNIEVVMDENDRMVHNTHI